MDDKTAQQAADEIMRRDPAKLAVAMTVAEAFFVETAEALGPDAFYARFNGGLERLARAAHDALGLPDGDHARGTIEDVDVDTARETDVTVNAATLIDALALIDCMQDHLTRVTGLSFNPTLPLVEALKREGRKTVLPDLASGTAH